MIEHLHNNDTLTKAAVVGSLWGLGQIFNMFTSAPLNTLLSNAAYIVSITYGLINIYVFIVKRIDKKRKKEQQ